MKYLEDLNKEQKLAVEHINGPALVIASAGSGKTRVLTYRIAHLIENGISPNNIIALTFTNKAARDMKDRIAKITGQQYASSLWMGTFHSIFARILRSEAEHLGFNSSFTIYDTADVNNAIKQIIKSLGLDDSVYKPNIITKVISAAKNNLYTATAYRNNSQIETIDKACKRPRTGEIYHIYEKKCRQANAMDFDDLLLYINILFKNNKNIARKYQQQFSHILVDEYQDTNMAQYMIVKTLGDKHQNIFIVGDDAQSIYSFRGAKIENILRFQKDYKGAKIFKLERNYRSTKNIVEAANSIILNNKEQLKKEAYSMNNNGDKIKIIKGLTDNEEGFLVIKELYSLYNRNNDTYSDYAILYRTNAQSRIFEEALRKRNIPYRIYGGLSFYQRKEIKDMIAYLRLVANKHDEEALRRIINFPKRGIGTTSIDKISAVAVRTGLSMWKIISNANQYATYFNSGLCAKLKKFATLIEKYSIKKDDTPAFDLAKDLAIDTGILQEFKSDKNPENVSKYDNLNELINGIQEFTELAYKQGETATLSSYLENISLLTDADKEDDNNDCVKLMTVHAAKGLEFDNVFIVGMEEKLFPSSIADNISPKAMEEERRLFYVALTRAKRTVCLSFAVTRFRWGKVHQESPSRFIFELDEKYLEHTIEKKAYSLTHQHTKSPQKTNYKIKNDYSNKSIRRWKKIDKQVCQSDFEHNDNPDFKNGVTVLHDRFGKGKVTGTSDYGQNKKVTINFKDFGEKTLLLKFAKLKVSK